MEEFYTVAFTVKWQHGDPKENRIKKEFGTKEEAEAFVKSRPANDSNFTIIRGYRNADSNQST